MIKLNVYAPANKSPLTPKKSTHRLKLISPESPRRKLSDCLFYMILFLQQPRELQLWVLTHRSSQGHDRRGPAQEPVLQAGRREQVKHCSDQHTGPKNYEFYLKK